MTDHQDLCKICGEALKGITQETTLRNRVKPTPYTPSKYEAYNLNKRKALDKKVQQCNRSIDMELQYKHGKYVLEMYLQHIKGSH